MGFGMDSYQLAVEQFLKMRAWFSKVKYALESRASICKFSYLKVVGMIAGRARNDDIQEGVAQRWRLD